MISISMKAVKLMFLSLGCIALATACGSKKSSSPTASSGGTVVSGSSTTTTTIDAVSLPGTLALSTK